MKILKISDDFCKSILKQNLFATIMQYNSSYLLKYDIGESPPTGIESGEAQIAPVPFVGARFTKVIL